MLVKRMLLVVVATLLLAAPSAHAAERTRIVFASGYDVSRFYNQIIPLFEERNPDVAVEVWAEDNSTRYNERLQVMAAGGQQLDVISLIPSLQPALIDAGLYRPLDDLIERDRGSYSLDDFDPVSLAANRWAGRQYGLPFRANMVWVIFQKEPFEQAGLANPIRSVAEGAWSIDTLVDLSRKLTRRAADGAVTAYGYSNVSTSDRFWAPFFWGFGGDFYTPDGKASRMAEPASVAALERIQQLAAEGAIFPTVMNDTLEQVRLSAMWQTWFGTVGFAQERWGVGNTENTTRLIGQAAAP